MSIRRRLRSVLWRVPIEQEVREEIGHHIELRTQELIDRGMDRDAARAEAQRRVGDVARLEARLAMLGADRNRTLARREWLGELQQDVMFALRQCRLQPGFTAAAVLTLALGIGATTAIFSIVHAVVLKPYPFADPERVLAVFTSWRGQDGDTSVGNFDQMQRRVTTLEHLAACSYGNFNLADDGGPERVIGLRTTWQFFNVFGVSPLHGRTYDAEHDQPGRSPVVVLTARLWQRRFAGDPQVIGRHIRMNGVQHEVIGVMPPLFDEFATPEELFVPIAFTPEQRVNYDENYLQLYARQRADVTLAQVNDELRRVAEELVRAAPRYNAERGARAEVASTILIGNYGTRLFVLLGAVTLVLLIACVNIANLLLARLASRARELAIRAAIGAGRGRIVRQVLTESLVLAAFSGAVGLLAAWWAIPVLIASAPPGVPRLDSARLDATVVAAALALVAATTLIVGCLPAWLATRGSGLRADLGDGKATSGGSLRPWVRQTLIASQAALVLIVLAGAALLVRSAINLQAVPIGFDTSGVLTARVSLPAAQYAQSEKLRTSFSTILTSVQGAPGVAVAALDSQPPLMGGGGGNGLLPEGKAEAAENLIVGRSHFVTPDYFRTLRIPMAAGRSFTDQDVRSAPLVMIISETLARQAFGGENAIGRRISCCEALPGKPSWKTVVAVVADVRARGPAQPPQPDFYLPMRQIPDAAWVWIGRSMNVIARSDRDDPTLLAGAIREGVRRLDPSLPVYGMRTMDEGLRSTMAQARFNTTLMSLLGITGLILAALGIYSVIAWLVAQRTREIGVRMALGASAADVVRDVTMHGMKPVVIGLIGGVIGALATTRLLEGQLFEVTARDPLALASVVVLMLGVAFVAGLVPASRVARIDPAQALHEG